MPHATRTPRHAPLADVLPKDLRLALLVVPLVESLERRQLMSGITQDGYALTLTGEPNAANVFDVRVVGRGLSMTVNGVNRWCDYRPEVTLKIVGGDASDIVYIDAGSKALIDTKGGDDSIVSGGGDDIIVAGPGRDTVHAGAGSDAVSDAETTSGVEVLTTTGTPSPIMPTPSPPTPSPPTPGVIPASMKLANGLLYVTGNASTSNTIRVTLDAASAKLLVTSNADVASFNIVEVKWVIAFGGDAADLIEVAADVAVNWNLNGGGGNDTLRGGGGAGTAWGGTGNDLISGGNGADYLAGGDGNDSVYGNSGGDSLFGNAGEDLLDGGAWADTLIGGEGNDVGLNGEALQSIESTSTGTVTPTPPPAPTPTPPPVPTPAPTPAPPPPGATGAGVPPLIGNVAAPVARINSVSGTSIVAGQSAHVDGLASTLNAGQAITARYEWNFGDPNGRFNSVVGFNASHVYDAPGAYTLTLRVINEGGQSSTTSAVVNVAADNRAAVYVSYWGNDNNAGTVDAPIRTITRAGELAGRADDVKILFKRGESFDVSTTPLWIYGKNVTVGAYGSGERPLIRYVGPLDRWRQMVIADASSQNVTIQDLTFDSIYNGTDGSSTNMPIAVMAHGKNLVVRNNQFLDVGFAMNINVNASGLTALDNIAPKTTGLRAYFMWTEGSNVVAMGNSVANSTREHIIRLSGARRVLVWGNDMTNLDRQSVDSSDAGKGVVAGQKGSYYYVANNRLNGPSGFGPLGGIDGSHEPGVRTLYAVFEGNYQTGAQFGLLHGAEHVMVRNNVFARDDNSAIQMAGFDNGYNRGIADVYILNNTAINNGTRGNFIRSDVPIDGVKVMNNLYVAPRLTTGSWGTASMAVMGSDLSSFTRIDGNNWGMPTIGSWADGGINWIGTSGTDPGVYQTPAEWNALWQVGTDAFTSVSLDGQYRPTVATAANTGLVIGGVFTDYYGNYRTGNSWTVGAVQAA